MRFAALSACLTAICSSLLQAAEPDAVRITACMPNAVESVMITYTGRLTAEGSPHQEFRSGSQTKDAEYKQQPAPADALRLAVAWAADAGIVVDAWGGSDFKKPYDLGVGDFNQRRILVTERPLDGFAKRLDECASEGLAGIARIETDGYAAFRGQTDRSGAGDRETVCIGILDSNTMAITESPGELAEIASNWRKQGLDLPARFALAREDLSRQPVIIVVRAFDPDQLDPVFGLKERDKEKPPSHLLIVTLDDPMSMVLRLRGVAPTWDDSCRQMFDYVWGRNEVEWRDGKFSGTADCATMEYPAVYTELIPMACFGLIMAF